MTTPAETTAERCARLTAELHRLRRIAPPDRTEADHARIIAARTELLELRGQPPAGYALPTIAQALIDHAHAHGWITQVEWTSNVIGWDRDPYVNVQVGRQVTNADRAAAEAAREYLGDGPHWMYDLCWHSGDCAPGRLRLFSSLAQTPDNPAAHGGPSVRGIRAVITAHPAPKDSS